MLRKQKERELLMEDDLGDEFLYTEENARSDFEILKSTLVNDENLDFFQEKLKLTRSYRLKILLNKDTDLMENFPYLFVRPELVGIL